MSHHSTKSSTSKDIFIYGRHPLELALKNPRRKILELYHTRDALGNIRLPNGLITRPVEKSFLDSLV